MTWSVIVPSRHPGKLRGFLKSLYAAQPDVTPEQIIVISDGISATTRQSIPGVTWVLGRKPFVFAEAINAGAKAAGDADLLIVGDDVRFGTRQIVDLLAERSDGVAAIAPEVDGPCGQVDQGTSSEATAPQWLAFICTYIPRLAWEAIGELDEHFVGYGCDDLDWSLRSRSYGPLVIDHSLRVVHLPTSSYRSCENWVELYEENKERFTKKWRGARFT
jgi:GT2 family glycosyltransferase